MRKFEIVTTYQGKPIQIPKRATEGSAGYDLACATETMIKPNEIKLVPTGLKVKMPNQEALFVFPRSSLAIKKGLMMSNSVGVIDADYYGNKDNEGHIMIPLLNITNQDVIIQVGERIAQGIFIAFEKTTDDEIDNVTRLGGFGSSGM